MTTTEQAPGNIQSRRHATSALAILALAMGGFGIGTTEFTMMGLLKEVEQGLNISTPEAGHLISAYALGVVIGAPVLAAVGAKLPRKYLALGLMLFFSVANLTPSSPRTTAPCWCPGSPPDCPTARSSASRPSSPPPWWRRPSGAGPFRW